jgi:hypothetical protein
MVLHCQRAGGADESTPVKGARAATRPALGTARARPCAEHLGAAYEQLDEYNADRLEAQLFSPVQLAYGRAKSTHARFADRHGIASRTFATPSPGIPSIDTKAFIDSGVNAVAEADSALSALQDSSLPTEVGDVELRAALTDVRELSGRCAAASPRA